MHIDPDDLRFERSLGRGSFSEVKLFTHLPSGHEYAVKCISKESISRCRDILYSSAKEYSVLTSCCHRHIIKLHSVFHKQGSLCFALDYCPQGDLHHYVHSHGPVSLKECKQIMQEIIEAVEYLHFTKKIVHGDIKPENIVFDEAGHIRLVDFGSSFDFDELLSDNDIRNESLEHLYHSFSEGRSYRYSDETAHRVVAKRVKWRKILIRAIAKGSRFIFKGIQKITRLFRACFMRYGRPQANGSETPSHADFILRGMQPHSKSPLCRIGQNKSQLCGTIDYMPPEMFLRSKLSAANDLWAIGCILYFLLNGHPPFEGSTDEIVASAVLTYHPSDGRLSFDKQASLEAIELTKTLLEPDLSKRMKLMNDKNYSSLKKHPFFQA